MPTLRLNEDALVSFAFVVTLGSLKLAFRECGGLGSESQVVEMKASSEKGQQILHKQPGTLKWQDISLKRGMTSDIALWNWRKEVEDGKVATARKNGSIELIDQTGKTMAQWDFVRAWPSKLSGPSLNAGSNEVAVEELVLVHEGCIRSK